MKKGAFDIALRQRIRQERDREQRVTIEEVCRRLSDGEIVRAVGNLLFHTAPPALGEKLKVVLDEISRTVTSGDPDLLGVLDFLVNLAIGLRSFLPNWVLSPALDSVAIDALAKKVADATENLTSVAVEAAAELAARVRNETIARLKAEGTTDESKAATMADCLMGNSLTDYVSNIAGELQRSNLMGVAEARSQGRTQTQLGNDYAAFLQYVIWLGGSFVTTNPALVKLAWDTDPELWNKRVDDLILLKYTSDQLSKLLRGPQSELNAAIRTINSAVTMAVVQENCRLLRDIFLVTEGREGYVSLQVNPKNHDDWQQMVTEAKNLYGSLEDQFGGVPNVVFKLPATAAGIIAAEKLTSEGIGVTITVEFSVFQALGFAEVLNRGKMLVAYLALMNGRLAYPVRDEMKTKGVPGGVEAARWAGVEVARKAYRRLYAPPEQGGMGVDPERIKLLVASLRIYDDWIPDISQLWGCPVITIFPNVRRKFDISPATRGQGLPPAQACPEPVERVRGSIEFTGDSVLGATPDDQLKVLLESEIFRQAWWVPGDPEQYRPKRVLTLETKDSEALLKWPPVANTLGEFIDLYEKMGQMVKERIRNLAVPTR
ncbi:MAG: transaldolase family protein [Sedimentisphaerales bacterium]|nr:transaldolase family protein [Sedimentisphaerales bacterium]